MLDSGWRPPEVLAGFNAGHRIRGSLATPESRPRLVGAAGAEQPSAGRGNRTFASCGRSSTAGLVPKSNPQPQPQPVRRSAAEAASLVQTSCTRALSPGYGKKLLVRPATPPHLQLSTSTGDRPELRERANSGSPTASPGTTFSGSGAASADHGQLACRWPARRRRVAASPRRRRETKDCTIVRRDRPGSTRR